MKNKAKSRWCRITAVAFILLLICVTAPDAAAKPPGGGDVVINTITHDATGTLHENDVLTVTMTGTAGFRSS